MNNSTDALADECIRRGDLTWDGELTRSMQEEIRRSILNLRFLPGLPWYPKDEEMFLRERRPELWKARECLRKRKENTIIISKQLFIHEG